MVVLYSMQMIMSCVIAFDLIVLVVTTNVQVVMTDDVVMNAGSIESGSMKQLKLKELLWNSEIHTIRHLFKFLVITVANSIVVEFYVITCFLLLDYSLCKYTIELGCGISKYNYYATQTIIILSFM